MKRAADTAAAAQKVSAKAEYMARPKSGNSSVAPSVTKPSSSPPSKGKSGRGSKHRHKPSFLAPGSLGGSGKQSRLVLLELASRWFEEALGGAGVTKDTHRRQRQAEKEREKERGPAKGRAFSSKREEGGP